MKLADQMRLFFFCWKEIARVEGDGASPGAERVGSAPGLPDCTGRRTVSLCSPPALLCVTPTGRQHPALQSENLSRMWAQQGGVLTV